MGNMFKKEEVGQFIEYAPVKKTNDKNQEYIQHTFVFKISTGVTEVTMTNDEYIEGVLKHFNVASIDGLVELLQKQPVPLFFVDSENFIGYSFTEGFKKNYFPRKMGQNVLITAVEDSNTNVCIELEDGTVANRRFTVKVVDPNGEDKYEFNPVKRLKFIGSLKLPGDKFNFDMNTLVGMRMDYVISTLGKNEYLEIVEIHPQTGTPIPNANPTQVSTQPITNAPQQDDATAFLNSLPQ